MSDRSKDWLNVSEAAAYLGVSRKALYHIMEQGLLPYTQVLGLRGRRIKKEDLDTLLQKSGGEDKRVKKTERGKA